MTYRDFLVMSLGNLWRLKLRTFLTVTGVVIAIAAFVSMLSFGAGMQRNVAEQFDKLGLFSIMQVYPQRDEEVADSSGTIVLDDDAIIRLSRLPGVNLVYPYDALDVKVSYADTVVAAEAMALPARAASLDLFSQMLAGRPFKADSANEVLVNEEFVGRLGVEPDSIIGHQLIVSVEVALIDSGLAAVMKGLGPAIGDRIRNFDRDSLKTSEYWQSILRDEAGAAVGRFVRGMFNDKAIITETLTIVGVMENRRSGRTRIKPIILPTDIARRFRSSGFSTDPVSLLSTMKSGSLLLNNSDSGRAYSQVTINLDPQSPYKPIRDSVEALGFRTFSYAEEFDEIRQFFVYFNLALGMVGLIALLTASLGIVNTMVMSTLERRREIGVMRSLGADSNDIRILFLVESGLIGLLGALLGVFFGWVISQVAAMVARIFMEREGITPMELFALPYWLIGTALLFGILVSLAAGAYPASRAASVDPVEALRNE